MYIFFTTWEDILRYPNIDTNTIDKNGDTPLIIAARNNNFSLVSQLLSHGALNKLRNHSGLTALDVAYQNKLELDNFDRQSLKHDYQHSLLNINQKSVAKIIHILKNPVAQQSNR